MYAPMAQVKDVMMDCLFPYAEHDLKDGPIVVLQCGHVYSVEFLDAHMGLSNVYVFDSEGRGPECHRA